MLDELKETKPKNFRERVDKVLTTGVIGLKHKLGFGIDGQSPSSIARARELHAPIRHKFKRRRVFVYNIDDIWSADLKDMSQLAKYNKGYKYLLNVIDLFSKYAYSIPLKTKKSSEVRDAFAKLFLSRKPKKLWTDEGSEFYNKDLKELLKEKNIELYHIYNEGKASVIERFNRTLGEMIAKHLTKTKSKNYIKDLQKLLDEYNQKHHTSIKMSPMEASNEENMNEVFTNLFPKTTKLVKRKFNTGDRVRIYRYKKRFEKGNTPNWTEEIFVINGIKNTDPVTYTVEDLNGEQILGTFYTNELLKTKF